MTNADNSATECPTDVVGHKTFATGKRDKHGLPIHRHEPLTRAEANALMESVERQRKRREELMPDEQSAIRTMCDAHQRLKEFGWSEAMYCPKDGSEFQVIEAGSSGIHTAVYTGEWPKGSYSVLADGDMWPSHPVLCKPSASERARAVEVRDLAEGGKSAS